VDLGGGCLMWTPHVEDYDDDERNILLEKENKVN